jgi:hypothetical protein
MKKPPISLTSPTFGRRELVYVHLRVAEIVMIAVPQWILKPQLLEDTEEFEDDASVPQDDPSDTTIH